MTHTNYIRILVFLAILLIAYLVLSIQFEQHDKSMNKYFLLSFVIVTLVVHAIRRKKVQGRYFLKSLSMKNIIDDFYARFSRKR